MKRIAPYDAAYAAANNYVPDGNGQYNADPDAPYLNGNPATGQEGSIPPFEAVDHSQKEIVKAVTAAGLTPAHNNLTQLAQSMYLHASLGIYGIGGGVKNAYTVTALNGTVPPDALVDGVRSMWIAPAANDAAVTLNAFALGTKPVFDISGNALTGGEIAGLVETLYSEAADGGSGGWLLVPWTSKAVSGLPIPKRIRLIDTTGTYTPTDSSVIAWDVILQAPGGGGGGVNGQGSGTVASATGGQGGGRSRKFILISDPATYSADFVIPAGGVGSAAGAGNGVDAGDITFDDGSITFDAPGGTGGEGDVGTSGASARAADDAIIGTTGDENYPTTRAGDANYFSGNYASRSAGGPSIYGTANRPASNTTPSASTGYGAGGTGANARATAGNYAGAAGAPAVAYIREYTR